jgi:hypothetical protein
MKAKLKNIFVKLKISLLFLFSIAISVSIIAYYSVKKSKEAVYMS